MTYKHETKQVTLHLNPTRNKFLSIQGTNLLPPHPLIFPLYRQKPRKLCQQISIKFPQLRKLAEPEKPQTVSYIWNCSRHVKTPSLSYGADKHRGNVFQLWTVKYMDRIPSELATFHFDMIAVLSLSTSPVSLSLFLHFNIKMHFKTSRALPFWIPSHSLPIMLFILRQLCLELCKWNCLVAVPVRRRWLHSLTLHIRQKKNIGWKRELKHL